MFSIIVMFTTISVFKECYSILIEAKPPDIRVDYIREDILGIKGVSKIDDFHCWSIAGGKNVLTAHICLEDSDDEENESSPSHHKK